VVAILRVFDQFSCFRDLGRYLRERIAELQREFASPGCPDLEAISVQIQTLETAWSTWAARSIPTTPGPSPTGSAAGTATC
jgi:hypothetical protein